MESVNSTVKLFIANIQGLGDAGKMAQLQARTSSSDFLVLNETNKRPGDESVFSRLKCVANVISHVDPDRVGPGYGTYLGSKRWLPDKGDTYKSDDRFEIIRFTRLLDK